MFQRTFFVKYCHSFVSGLESVDSFHVRSCDMGRIVKRVRTSRVARIVHVIVKKNICLHVVQRLVLSEFVLDRFL